MCWDFRYKRVVREALNVSFARAQGARQVRLLGCIWGVYNDHKGEFEVRLGRVQGESGN